MSSRGCASCFGEQRSSSVVSPRAATYFPLTASATGAEQCDDGNAATTDGQVLRLRSFAPPSLEVQCVFVVIDRRFVVSGFFLLTFACFCGGGWGRRFFCLVWF